MSFAGLVRAMRLGTLCCLLVAGCGSESDNSESSAKDDFKVLSGGDGGGSQTLQVGMIVPLTGTAAQSGEQLMNGAILALDERGWRVGDYNIEIVLIDEASDSEGKGVARDNYKKAIEAFDLDVGFLNWHSAVAL